MFREHIAVKRRALTVAATASGMLTYLSTSMPILPIRQSTVIGSATWQEGIVGLRHNWACTIPYLSRLRKLEGFYQWWKSLRCRSEIDAGKSLSVEDYEHLLRLVKIAKDWNKAEESSAPTEPEETPLG